MPVSIKTFSKYSADDKIIVLTGGKNAKSKDLPFASEFEHIINEKIKAGKTDILTLYHQDHKNILGFYYGKENDVAYRLEDIRLFASKICKLINKEKFHTVKFVGLSKLFNKQEAIAFIEGIELTNYEFLKYKSKKAEAHTLKTIMVEERLLDKNDITELENLFAAVAFTKDIVNEPVITLNAEALSDAIVKQGKTYGFNTKILRKAEIEKLGMGGLLGVNRGSDDPPTFNILEYKPRNAVNKHPLVFVGKGVVYDTGGYSLKVGGVMMTMKCDMAGAAAVVGAITAISANKLPLHVVGLIPATDNRIGHNALVVDDVITMHDGTTVEIQNTDAEGRLILGDALSYAKKYNPELVIDLATLTGAASAITGFYGIALMTNNPKYKQTLMQSGEEVYERCAELPMWREYKDLIKSDIADIRNVGGPTGGVMTAAKFLEHFTNYPWIHLDIAGPAFIKEGAKDYHHKGGTAVGVRLLYNFAKKMTAKKKK